MEYKMPKTPFVMSLSGSAKETELRIRNIFQWKKKRPPMIALVAAVLVVVLCGSLIGFTTTPRSGTLGEVYQEYFAENPTNQISYDNKEAMGYPSLDPESENFGAALEYVCSMELRSVLGGKKYIGDFDNRNGAVVLRSVAGQDLWIDLYRTGYVVVSNEGAGRLGKGDDAKVYKVSEAFAVETVLNYLSSASVQEPTAEFTVGEAPVQPSGDQVPEFLNDIGKTLGELKNEHTEGEFIVSLDGFPDSAAACFGEQGAKYVYFFFGGHDGDFEKAMTECEEQIKCSGFITTANMLFTDMGDDMSFEDFFSLIGVDDYEYFGEDTITAEGWLKFTYNNMEVMVNTNEAVAGGGWDVTGAERVKSNAPVSIVDPEILNTNQNLAEAVMFD